MHVKGTCAPFSGSRATDHPPVLKLINTNAPSAGKAACRDHNPDLFFPAEDAPAELVRVQEATAKAVCRSCPVAGACLSTALSQRLEFGVWGGLTAEDRKAVLASRSGTQTATTATSTRTSNPSTRTVNSTKRTRVRRRTTVRHTAPAATAPVSAADLTPAAVSV
jgi:WhiB family redox-sensing transcriptional regulator